MKVFEKLEVLVEQRKDYRAKLIIAGANDNGGTPPSVAVDGRLHAPYGGYNWDEVTYAAGEFLHNPLGEGLSKITKTRFKIRKEDFNEFAELFHPINNEIAISTGKVWDQNGISVCYLWMSASNYLCKKIDSVVSEISTNKELVLEEEIDGRPHGQPFIFNMRKIVSILNDPSSAWEGMLIHEGMDKVPLTMDDKTNKWTSSWKKKSVAYVYPIGIVEVK